jgi:hypothetical protein
LEIMNVLRIAASHPRTAAGKWHYYCHTRCAACRRRTRHHAAEKLAESEHQPGHHVILLRQQHVYMYKTAHPAKRSAVEPRMREAETNAKGNFAYIRRVDKCVYKYFPWLALANYEIHSRSPFGHSLKTHSRLSSLFSLSSLHHSHLQEQTSSPVRNDHRPSFTCTITFDPSCSQESSTHTSANRNCLSSIPYQTSNPKRQ